MQSKLAWLDWLIVISLFLIGLKLTGGIDWSWWLVLAPVLLTALGWVVLFIVIVIMIVRQQRGRDN